MFLACDIGNSFIKVGLFEKEVLSEAISFQSADRLTEVISRNEISAAGISSVVPATTEKVIKLLDNFSIAVHIISASSAFSIKTNYKTPETLGIDRLCSAEGAYFLNSGIKEDEILLSIDMGTATTINLIRHPGEFIGGVIAPGINMMANALHSYTAQLPEVIFEDYEGAIGNSTRSSIASGLINATLGMIERITTHLKKTYPGKKIKIYLTGGNAEKIIPHLETEYTYQKYLVLYGIMSVGSRIAGKDGRAFK